MRRGEGRLDIAHGDGPADARPEAAGGDLADLLAQVDEQFTFLSELGLAP